MNSSTTYPIRVLVTGAGSGVGQGIIKALRLSTLPIEIVSSDISPFQAGLYRADKGLVLPKVEAVGALEAYIDAIRDERISVVMIGSEFDLEFFSKSRDRIERETGAQVVVSPLAVVSVADDKWETARFLESHGLPFARSFIADDEQQALVAGRALGYPCILKPRADTASRHVHVIASEIELVEHFPSVPNPMIQELLALPSSKLGAEYTCGLFKTISGKIIGPCVARRTLRHGTSWVVEVVEEPSFHPLLRKIVELLDIVGPFNIQCMRTERGLVPFEFNARFSGTTPIRAHFGFNEPEMAVRHLVLKDEIGEPRVKSGIALRYIEEIFVDDASADNLSPGMRGTVRQWF